MEDDQSKFTVEVNKEELKHQLGKLLFTTTAGFVAKAAAEVFYDKFVLKKTSTAEEEQ